MRAYPRLALAVVTILPCIGDAAETGSRNLRASAFEEASVHFEQNATDADAEVVFEIGGGDAGLARLTVVSPDGRPVIEFSAPDASTLGIRKFHLESPEPNDVDSLQSAYPEGTYAFTGTDVTGRAFHGESALDHRLPTPAAILSPHPGALDVPREGLVVVWKAVGDAVGYVVEIEQDELDMSFSARLPASFTRLAVPSGMLSPRTRYQLSIATISAQGNISVLETIFTTAD